MHTCRCFFTTLGRACCADVCTWDGSQDQQSPTKPPSSPQYFISTNSTLSHKDGWKIFLQPPSAFPLPRKVLNSKFCTRELHCQILCLWITYYYYIQIQTICFAVPHQFRTGQSRTCNACLQLPELKTLTILSGIFKDQNKSLRSAHLLNDEVFHHGAVILSSHRFV